MSRRKVPSNEILRELYLSERLTASEIGRRCHVSRGNVGKALKRAGVQIRRQAGPDHHRWKGGRVMLPQGVAKGKPTTQTYWGIWMPSHHRANKSGYVKEHILVAEKILGRPLEKNEIVHHINFDGLDNDPVNLAVFQTSRDHLLSQLSVQHLVKPLLKEGIIRFDGKRYVLSQYPGPLGGREMEKWLA